MGAIIIKKAQYVIRIDENDYIRLSNYKNGPTLLALYLFYQHQAIKQQSPKIRATIGYCATALDWDVDKVRWIKNILVKEKLIHEVTSKKSGDGHSYIVLNKMVDSDEKKWVI